MNIVVLIFVISLFGGLTFAFGQNNEKPSCTKMIDILDLNHNKAKYGTNIKDLTKNFCNIVSESECVHDDDIFDAQKSVFLTLLCQNVGEGELFDNGYQDFLLKTGFDQFGIFDYGSLDTIEGSSINFCDYKTNLMNGCDYSKELPKMFDEIINDYFNIKQADLYGVDTLKEGRTSEMMVKDFSVTNFVGLDICDPNDDYYDDTCRYLKDHMTNVKNLLKTTTVIDVQKLSTFIDDTEYCNKNEEDILYCGLLGNNTLSRKNFINTVYNEYLRYRLFISYYSYEISLNPNYSEYSEGNDLEKLNWNNEKIYSFQEQIYRSVQAISTSIRSLAEISNSFALHVGFLMYQEDLKIFMKDLSKLYPPIRTLYDKLRNVQKP